MEGKKTDSRLILKEKMSDNHCRNPPAHSCHQQMVVICDPIIGRGVSRADNVFQDTGESEDITTCYPGDGISAGPGFGLTVSVCACCGKGIVSGGMREEIAEHPSDRRDVTARGPT